MSDVESLKKHKLSYYNYDKILSFNATYNFIIGARGLGKTYGAKVKTINKFFNRGEQFIYLRRYSKELKSRYNFFADLDHLYPEWDFRVHGMEAQCAHVDTRDDKKRHWDAMGYFIALSTSQQQKSNAFPLVTTIIFDEFIIEKGMLHYLPGEAEALNNLYATVDRWQDKTRVLFLANSVSIMNPYFMEYNIRPDELGEYSKHYDGFIACHFADSAKFANEVYKTAFGRFIADTDYADYAVGSTFSDANDSLIAVKDQLARYHYTIETHSSTFSVWINWNEPTYYIQEKRPKQEMIFTLVPERMEDHKTLLHYNDRMIQVLRTGFRQGKVWFSTPQLRNSFLEIFKR